MKSIGALSSSGDFFEVGDVTSKRGSTLGSQGGEMCKITVFLFYDRESVQIDLKLSPIDQE